MSVANSITSKKCIICFCTVPSERTNNSEQFAKVFDTFCQLLKIDLIKPMQWNFEEDYVPFCEFCFSHIEKLEGIYDQIESLQQQTANILNRIKHEIKISESEPGGTNELPADERVNYFRHLVIGGSPVEDDFTATAEVTSLNVDPMVEVATHFDTLNATELSLPESIDERCEFEDAEIECDPLLTMKRESDGTYDSFIDVESFPHDNLEIVTASIYLEPTTNVSSASVFDCVNKNIKKEDLDGEHRCRFCEETLWTTLSLELHLKQHQDKKKVKVEKCNESTLSRNDVTANDQKQVHGIQLPKNNDIVENERRLVIKLTGGDFPLSGNKSEVKLDKKNTLCKVCDKDDASSEKFSKFHSLTCYKRIHTGEMKYKCDFCDKTYQNRYLLIRHRRSHTGEKVFKCDICNKLFKRLGNLKIHERSHSAHRPFKCEICGKLFKVSGALRSHMLIHTGEKPFQCGVCLKKFTQRSTLNVHGRIHTGEKPFKCDVCNKSFYISGALTIHKRLHTGDKPFKCEVCNKMYVSSGALSYHRGAHGVKPFKCDVCNKSFTRSSASKLHRRIHTGEKPFKCDVCNKSFISSNKLTLHKRVHTGERPFKCEICNKMYTSSSALLKHRRTCHAE